MPAVWRSEASDPGGTRTEEEDRHRKVSFRGAHLSTASRRRDHSEIRQTPTAGQSDDAREVRTSRQRNSFLAPERAIMSTSPGAPRPIFADAEAMKERLRQNMCQPQYDVMDFYKTTGMCQRIARHQVFHNITLAVIFGNALWIWLETDYNPSPQLNYSPWYFQVGEHAFCSYFVFEWAARFGAFKYKRNCLKDPWFLFDSCMLASMVFETWVVTSVLVFLETKTNFGSPAIIKLLRLLRLSRMARLARLMRAMPELLILVKGMMAAVRSVFFTLLLLVIVLYIFGIAFTQLLKDRTDGLDDGFTTVPFAMHTLLLHGTLGDQMTATVEQLGQVSGSLIVLFYLFVLISALTVLNMLIGVLCEVVNAVAATEREELTVTYVKSKLQETLIKGGLDLDNDGVISREEFVQILDNTHAARTLSDVGVDVFNLVDLQDFIFEEDDESGQLCEKRLTFAEFMQVVLQLRGSNQATVKDVVDLRKFVGIRTRELEARITGVIMRSLSATIGQIPDFPTTDEGEFLQREQPNYPSVGNSPASSCSLPVFTHHSAPGVPKVPPLPEPTLLPAAIDGIAAGPRRLLERLELDLQRLRQQFSSELARLERVVATSARSCRESGVHEGGGTTVRIAEPGHLEPLYLPQGSGSNKALEEVLLLASPMPTSRRMTMCPPVKARQPPGHEAMQESDGVAPRLEHARHDRVQMARLDGDGEDLDLESVTIDRWDL